MPEIFTWKNCMADVYNYRYGAIAKDFLTLVVNPSLDALDAQVKHWQQSADPVSGFIISDLNELIYKTRMAFCLSIQSLWEQQIRTYLAGCQHELGINPFPVSNRRAAKSVQAVYWGDELNTVFERLRNITLPSFASFESLDLLMLVGNVCRHGDGSSSARLWSIRPDLWPDYHDPDNEFLIPTLPDQVPPVQSLEIPREMLEDFVDKIFLFWEDTNYIYEESIERKHPSLEARLVVERAERAERARGIRHGGLAPEG